MRILVDTNVLLRRAQVTSAQHLAARNSLQALIEADTELCLLPHVVYKYWVAATRPTAVNGLGMAVKLVETAVAELLQDFVLLKDERGIFNHWRALVVVHSILGKNAHDARLVAAMQRHGVAHLLTFNGPDFARFPGIKVLSPAEIVAGRLPA